MRCAPIDLLTYYRRYVPIVVHELSASVIAAPVTILFNQSIRCAVILQQWKKARITPTHSISCTSSGGPYQLHQCCRAFWGDMINSYSYSALVQPPQGLHFADQFAYRSTWSTNAALITLSHTVFNMLSTQPFAKRSIRSETQPLGATR